MVLSRHPTYLLNVYCKSIRCISNRGLARNFSQDTDTTFPDAPRSKLGDFVYGMVTMRFWRNFLVAKLRRLRRPDQEEFRVLELYPVKKGVKKSAPRTFNAHVLPPREKRMKVDQDWPSVWPTAKTFRPSVVPLPLYQGYDQKRAPPGKYANAELMKIPNFLHLTPLAIKRHCEAIKKFCTEWPKGLETDEDCDEHFPLEVITSDYCHSSPTIRDERSRIVTIKLKLAALNLDYHGRDKLIRLVGPERYNKNTDMLEIVADRCPLRQQNYDYLIYILTALHHESWVTEPWEHEKTEADMEKFFFEGSRIEKHIVETLTKVKLSASSDDVTLEKDIKESEEVAQFGNTVTALINEGENEQTILNYKNCVLKLLDLKHSTHAHV